MCILRATNILFPKNLAFEMKCCWNLISHYLMMRNVHYMKNNAVLLRIAAIIWNKNLRFTRN